MQTAGIHHITAIAGDPQQNVDFYTELLGLRLIKRTVNFDDPGSYHFYFGDEIGRPGTIITFFPWPGARRGTRGSGQVTAVSFAVPAESLGWWEQRLRENQIMVESSGTRFDRPVLRFLDADGLMLELIGAAPASTRTSVTSDQDEDHGITCFAAPTLQVSRPVKTEKILTDVLGFEFVGEEGQRWRFRGANDSPNSFVDVVASDTSLGHVAVGTVHHIAFRAANEETQLEYRERLIEMGVHVTPVIDRQYFHSIYFREPSGILFEIATDEPGFLIDEAREHLGEQLKLPAQYESMRAEIERSLPSIHLSHAVSR